MSDSVTPRRPSYRARAESAQEVERALAVAEALDGLMRDALNGVVVLSSEDDDPMHRTAECIDFARRQMEDVLGGLRRASARLRDDLGVPRLWSRING